MGMTSPIDTSPIDLKTLAAAYDKGLLVPFIGSGMSSPTCRSWQDFVSALETKAALPANLSAGLMQRAMFALQCLRRKAVDVAEAIEEAVYTPGGNGIPDQTLALANLYWPLICSTNYDDLYLRAVRQHGRTLPQGRALPQVYGRSEIDCRRVLQHLSFPAAEAVWNLQGFLGLRDAPKRDDPPPNYPGNLKHELVVGHAEYRLAAHRAPHFRRCFAEIYRTRSLLFLGSGLAEPYFLTLFDEIIELCGPPVRPHFAFVEEGTVDPAFMRLQYHILCYTYPRKQHEHVTQLLQGLGTLLSTERVRTAKWAFQFASPKAVDATHSRCHFNVLRCGLPSPDVTGPHEAMAVSCGRGGLEHVDPDLDRMRRGVPLPSGQGMQMLGLSKRTDFAWLGQSNWVVQWEEKKNAYGIVARDLISPGDHGSRDRRSPEAIRLAFYAFLDEMLNRRVERVHVQLLSAGHGKAFHPWIALVQMARAYGQWCKDKGNIPAAELVDVNLYVVDPSVIALLQGGYVNVVEHLEDMPMCIGVDVIEPDGQINRHYQMVKANDTLKTLMQHIYYEFGRDPVIYPLPAPHSDRIRQTFRQAMNETARDLGLVSGSTLIVDFRTDTDRADRQGAACRTDAAPGAASCA
jgi:hypothetical protein